MTEEADVRAAVLDYVEGWFDGNAGRMERTPHPELVKRCRGLEGDDPDVMETLTAREMIDATAEGIGHGEDAEDREIDLLHLLHMPQGWRIINAAWELR
jgi:hypothetical protein